MLNYINYRMKVTLLDSRVLVGYFMAFDKHMNLVLGDCEEFRTLRAKVKSTVSEERVEKRHLGLVLLRGESVVSLTVEGPLLAKENETVGPNGPGVARAAGRGIPTAPMGGASLPMGLMAPMRGIGGPPPGMMQPGQGTLAFVYSMLFCIGGVPLHMCLYTYAWVGMATSRGVCMCGWLQVITRTDK